MTFDEALEAMKQGKKAKIIGDEYPYFIKDGVMYHYEITLLTAFLVKG